MKRVLVTGDQGFLGRHFKEGLRRHPTFCDWPVTGVDVAARKPEDARDFFRHYTPCYDLVIHLAAVVGGRARIEGAPLDLAVDLSIDAELAQWAIRTRPGHLVYLSSSAAYPAELQQGQVPFRLAERDVDLDRPRPPDAIYGWVKLTGEMLMRHVAAAGIPVTVVRPFSGYGADQSPVYPFRAFLERARRRADPFEIWGNGRQVRDWVHVSDVVGATLEFVRQGVTGPVNVCTGEGTDFEALATIFAEAAGYWPKRRYVADAPLGVCYRVGDPTLMRRFYEPKVELEHAVREAVRGA